MALTLYKNTFVTLEEAETYFQERYNSAVWHGIEESDKEKLLITASRRVDAFDFVGTAEHSTQPMAFPRNFEMPQDIKDAVCEEALSLAIQKDDVHKINQDANITSISLGAGSVSYGAQSMSEESKMLISNIALYLVKRWIKKGFNIPC